MSEKLAKHFHVQGDMVVWMIFLLLCSISIVEVYSASSSMTYKSGAFWEPILKHGLYVGLGMIVTWIVHMTPCRFFKFGCVVLLLASYLLLVVALFSAEINGASRWVGYGFISIQPSELAKVSLIGFVALIASAVRTNGYISKLGMKIICTCTGLALLLIFTENGSTAVLIGSVIFLMLCYAKAPNKFLGWVVGVGAVCAISAAALLFSLTDNQLKAMHDHPVLHRVPTWANRLKGTELPEDPMKYDIYKNVQVTHAQIAVATGSVFGKGPGNSVQRDYLPQAFSDFIFAIIIEEWGLIGAAFVMFLYLLLMYRALRIAGRCSSLFPAYLVMGLALMMVIQALMNMAVAVGAMPVTGQPLPLISKGGTSTFISCAYIGMILSVSWSARKREEAPVETAEGTVQIMELENKEV